MLCDRNATCLHVNLTMTLQGRYDHVAVAFSLFEKDKKKNLLLLLEIQK